MTRKNKLQLTFLDIFYHILELVQRVVSIPYMYIYLYSHIVVQVQ